MKNKKYIVVLASIVLMLIVGTMFLWSLFNAPIIQTRGWTKTSVVFTFSIMLFFFSIATMIGGFLQDRIGPRVITTIGSILYGVGVLLSGSATEIWQLYIYYGLIAGIGGGFIYVAPVATCVKYFPNNKGLITGISTSAFGFAGIVFKPVVLGYLNNLGVKTAFLYLGIIYLVVAIISSQFLFNPNNLRIEVSNEDSDIEKHKSPKQVLKDKRFYILAIIYMLGASTCLTIIGLAKDIGVDFVKLSVETAANAVVIIALFNALSRIFWGILSDKIGNEKSFIIIYILMTISMAYPIFCRLTNITFSIDLIIMATSFGGMLTVIPTITSEYYGTKHLGVNYGMLFVIYGIGALIGPIIATIININIMFIISTFECIIAVILCFILFKIKNKIVIR